MRAFVFFLILANLLFLAWAQGYLGASSNPDALRIQQQLLAERVRVVARDEPPSADQVPAATPAAAPAAHGEKTEAADPATADSTADKADKVDKAAESAAAGAPAKATEACLQLAEMPLGEVERIETLAARDAAEVKVVRAASREGNASYWVYIPPLATRRDAENKVNELKKLQVSDYFIMQENGPNNRAISLGLFSTREAAETYLEELRGKKVRSAQIAEKNIKPTLVVLELRGQESALGALGKTVATTFPDSKPAACKTAQ